MELPDAGQVEKVGPTSTVLPILPPFDAENNTKKYCTYGLYLSGAIRVVTFIAGIALCIKQERAQDVNLGALEISSVVAIPLSLLFNLIVAICTDALSYIHYMSLRWALFHEGRLKLNSNLRLFTSARTCPANRASVNYTSLVLLVISYTGASQAVSHRNGSMSFGGIALLLLGLGLLGQVAISAYCLYGKVGRKILSWSASPLNTALACLHHGLYTRRPGRGMMGVESKDLPSGPQRPRERQPSMRKPCGATCNIVYLLFFLAFLTIVLAVTIYTLCLHLDRVQYYSFFSDGDHEVATTGIRVGIQTSYVLLPQFLVFLFGLAMQSIITFALHCAELVVNVSRDERSWRAAAKPAGTALGDGAVKSARTSLAWLFLFVLKPILQWLFGAQGISYSNNQGGSIEFNPIPLFVLAGVATLLAVFVTCLVCRKQRGPQPAAYGHLQTMVDCIDDWGQGDTGRLWWGYKGLGAGRVGIVGTSGIQGAVWPVNFERTYQ